MTPSTGEPPPGQTEKTAILLLNLGTPQAPTPAALRRFLREFLSDPRVVALPRLLWWPILNLFILTTRPRKSAEKYQKIWTPQGSPLRVHTERQAKLLRGYLGQAGHGDLRVDWAMRYGRPSIAEKLDELQAAGCRSIRILPLYPQYSFSTTASTADAIEAWRGKTARAPRIDLLADFHDHPGYIRALAASVGAHWMDHGRAEVLLMSYHGLPRKSLAQGDPYASQCHASSRLLAAELGLADSAYRTTFQSRFGPAPWLQPYTLDTLLELARGGTRRVDVLCPGFVSDGLETLEEIALEARAAFLQAGGEEFHLIACLNERHEWIEALVQLALGEPRNRS